VTLPLEKRSLLLIALAALAGCAHSSKNQKADEASSNREEAPIGVSNEEALEDDEEGAEEESAEDEASIEEQLALQAVRDSLGATSDDSGDSNQAGESEASSNGPLRFTIIQQGPDQPWVMGVVNDGQDWVELVADPRLVRFEVKVPGKKKAEKCQLPDDLFPKRGQRQYRVYLGPGQGVVKAFDPRLYCFASTGQHVLVPGAIISPSFGWPEKTKTVWKGGKRQTVKLAQEEPFVARIRKVGSETSEQAGGEPAAAGESEAAANAAPEPNPDIKTLSSPSFSLGSDYRKWSAAGLPEKEADPSPIGIEMRQGSDAHSQMSATIAITLVNREKKTRYVYFRRELLSFEVMGPGGFARCDPQPDVRVPDRHGFLRLAPGQKMTITSRLIELCPVDTFARPGFYIVHARFDAEESGEEYDLDAYVGRVATQKPANVRIRTGELFLNEKQAMRPLQVREVQQ